MFAETIVSSGAGARLRFIVLVIVAAVMGLAGCGGEKGKKVKPSVHVVSFSPERVTQDNFATVRITFDRPVAGEDETGRALKEKLVENGTGTRLVEVLPLRLLGVGSAAYGKQALHRRRLG